MKSNTTKPRSKKRSVAPKGPIAFVGTVREMGIAEFARERMTTYSDEVNMARSVPDLIDGCKPVQRRILWEAYLQRGAFVKTARIVGGVIGRWHPHGDGSVEDAVTKLVQHPVPPMLGQGNWGGLLDSAAAMRYTGCKLSAYGEDMFQSDYINKEVTSFILNYDDVEYEPLSLPCLLPNVLLNGGEGIGVGVTTSIPTFTPESVVAILKRMLAGEELTALDFAKTMKISLRWGGKLINSKENKAAWLALFKTGSSSLQFQAELKVDRDRKAIDIDSWPPGLKVESFVTKVRAMPETDQVFNAKGSTGFRIEMRKAYNYTQFDAFVAKIEKLARSRQSYKINVTYRTPEKDADGVVRPNIRFLSTSIPKLLKMWLRERLLLERRSLQFRLKKQAEAIAYSELLIFACSKLDVIFAALRAQDPNAYLVKHLKISVEQADQILDLKVRQLSKLDREALKDKLKQQQGMLKQLNQWYAKPRPKVAADFDTALLSIVKDRAYQAAKSRKISV